MSTFESKIKTILHPQETIYSVLSDLNHLKSLEHRIPKDKIKDISFEKDSITASIDKLGKVTFRIINKEPVKTIKFIVEGVPSEANLWIQLKEVKQGDTKMKLTLKASLNPMLKMMLKNKIGGFLDQFAETLSGLDYSTIGQ